MKCYVAGGFQTATQVRALMDDIRARYGLKESLPKDFIDEVFLADGGRAWIPATSPSPLISFFFGPSPILHPTFLVS